MFLLGRKGGRTAAHVPCQVMKRNNHATKVDAFMIPQPHQAVVNYRLNGGKMDIEDPLFHSSDKIYTRFQSFTRQYPSFEAIFHRVVNEDTSVFVDALTCFIDLTFRLCNS